MDSTKKTILRFESFTFAYWLGRLVACRPLDDIRPLFLCSDFGNNIIIDDILRDFFESRKDEVRKNITFERLLSQITNVIN